MKERIKHERDLGKKLVEIFPLEEKCMKNKAIIEYVIRWLDSNIDETIIYNPPHSLATDSADLKEKIQLALDPEVTTEDVNNGDFG